jgi:hypothetical protein
MMVDPTRAGKLSGLLACDLGFRVGAGEGNRTLMTSLEGVPQQAVTSPDLAILMTADSCYCLLLTVVNGTLMARPALLSEFFNHGVGVGVAGCYDLVALGEVQAVCVVLPLDTETHLPDAR